VAQPTDDTKAGTLPDPELNPLLNPLLAANMGRWAEVYFTNPPEKRAQAVADLLRELESNPQSEAVPRESGEKAEEALDKKVAKQEDPLFRDSHNSTDATFDRASVELASVCAGCGHTNRGTQRFCGMCGMPLAVDEPSSSLPLPQPVRQTSWHDQTPSAPANGAENAPTFYQEFRPEYMGRSHELASMDPLVDDAPDHVEGLFHYQSEPRHRYRLYIGIALAVIIALLVYRAWRGNLSFQKSASAPSALPQDVPDAQPQSAKSAAAAPASPAQDNSKTGEDNAKASSPPAHPTQPGLRRPERATDADSAATPRENSLNSAGGQASFGTQNGANELATAERYLNGAAGTHNSQEAASWLWKSVAKQNLTAALLLSDLYVHGDGVAKSCDQARLLLDAAARKGSAAAAVRLRNLPAFGCQ
jgi:hypothetical protein